MVGPTVTLWALGCQPITTGPADTGRRPGCDEPEVPYDGIDNDCTPTTPDDDLDGDGFGVEEDCDDTAPDIHPGVPETHFDGIDNDCDPSTLDEDVDGDGVPTGEDCDDQDPTAQWSDTVFRLDADQVPGFCEGYCERRVSGSINISASTLTNLDDLQGCLAEFDGLILRDNLELVSIAGLSGALADLDEGLTISNNPKLQSLEGLDTLGRVGGNIEIEGTLALQTLEGVGAAQSASFISSVSIQGNPGLKSLRGLEGFGSIGFLRITQNAGLTDLEGLGELGSDPPTMLWVRNNEALTSLAGLEEVTRLSELLVYDNRELTTLEALGGLTTVDFSLVVRGNRLPSLAGLDGLEHVGGLFEVSDEPSLTTLAGLSALRTVGWDLTIFDNLALTDVTALYGLESVGASVQILGNQSLTDAAGQELVDAIGEIGGDTTVADNQPR